MRKVLVLVIALLVQLHLSAINADSKPANPPASENLIVVYGDTRSNPGEHRKLVKLIEKVQPYAIFHVGDMVFNGYDESEWTVFNEITADMIRGVENRFYPVMGNHESPAPLYYQNFKLPENKAWYSVNIDKIHFVILDSNKSLDKHTRQYKWLEADLKASSIAAEYLVVLLHHPLFTSVKNGESLSLQKSLLPILLKYKVDLVMCGDKHNYERSQYEDLCFIVTGGGGAPLYSATKDPQVWNNAYSKVFIKTYEFCVLKIEEHALKVNAYNDKNEQIDEISILPKDRK